MMISVIYFDKDQYVYKKGIVTNVDLEYKKSITIVDKCISINNIININYKF